MPCLLIVHIRQWFLQTVVFVSCRDHEYCYCSSFSAGHLG